MFGNNKNSFATFIFASADKLLLVFPVLKSMIHLCKF
jgi:hypothetical protein